MIVHDKPRDWFITSGRCNRSFVFIKPVCNIRGNKKRRQVLDVNSGQLCNHIITVCSGKIMLVSGTESKQVSRWVSFSASLPWIQSVSQSTNQSVRQTEGRQLASRLARCVGPVSPLVSQSVSYSASLSLSQSAIHDQSCIWKLSFVRSFNHSFNHSFFISFDRPFVLLLILNRGGKVIYMRAQSI